MIHGWKEAVGNRFFPVFNYFVICCTIAGNTAENVETFRNCGSEIILLAGDAFGSKEKVGA